MWIKVSQDNGPAGGEGVSAPPQDAALRDKIIDVARLGRTHGWEIEARQEIERLLAWARRGDEQEIAATGFTIPPSRTVLAEHLEAAKARASGLVQRLTTLRDRWRKSAETCRRQAREDRAADRHGAADNFNLSAEMYVLHADELDTVLRDATAKEKPNAD